MTTAVVLGRRALNRALLARQHLLERATMPASAMIGHLVGMQAQAPLAAYVALWSRLSGFETGELASLTTSRAAVRALLMRGTVHLVVADDALSLRPLVEPVLKGGFTGHFSRQIEGVDLDAVTATGRELLEERPRTRKEMRDLLGARWPERDSSALAYAVSYLVPTVQVTPRGVWGSTGPASLATMQSWVGRPLDPAPSLESVVRRYLAAFGPASVGDVQTWSGLTRLREVVERLDGLRTFRANSGEILYDVEDGPLPEPDVPAPVRFLPEYDNVLLSHADRSRVIPVDRRVPLPPGNGAAIGTVLVDGYYEADWRLRRADGRAALNIAPFRRLTSAERSDLTAEGTRLAGFVAPDVPVDLRFVSHDGL